MIPALRAENITVGYGANPVIRDVSLDVPAGAVTMIIGPNGCGKSTLLKALGRLLPLQGGNVLLDGENIATADTRAIAKRMSILPQNPIAPAGITVRDLVARGRYPHRAWWQRNRAEDTRAIEEALATTSLSQLADREMNECSGGQRQRAWIAMSLAQQADILLLDEPTNHLDISHQLDVLALVEHLVEEDSTAVVVLHDLTLAARYGQHLVVMKQGRIVAQGPPQATVTPKLCRDVFDLEARILQEETTNSRVVFPLKRAKHESSLFTPRTPVTST